MLKSNNGFTIIELLIVIVVIAILAAITIASFNGIQLRARESEVKSSTGTAKKQLMLYQVENGKYPDNGNHGAAGVISGSVTYQYTQLNSGTGFCLTGSKSGVAATVTENTSPSIGTCSGHGADGLAVVDNVLLNPSFETDTSGWGCPCTGGTIARVSGGAGIIAGNAALEATMASPNNHDLRYAAPELSSYTTYTLSMYFTLMNNSSGSFQLSAGNSGGVDSFTATQGVTTRRVITWTTADTTASKMIRILKTSPAVNYIYRIDAVMVEQGSTASSYVD